MSEDNQSSAIDDQDSEELIATTGKRKAESSSGNKKRFIWPTGLHHSFIAAVFDIGLRQASPKELITLLGGEIDSDLYGSHLQKLKAFRDPSRQGYSPYYDKPQFGVPPTTAAPKLTTLQSTMRRSLNSRVIQMGHAMALQASFLEHLQINLQRQTALYTQLAGHHTSSESESEAERECEHEHHEPIAHEIAHEPHANGPQRAELSMIHEMREQMSLHRQLLLKRESLQVPEPPREDEKWDEDALFFFLDGEFAASPLSSHEEAEH